MSKQYTTLNTLKIGTRGSPLALAQAHEARALLMVAHDMPEDAFEIKVIQTTGDAVQDRPLSEIGGKGLFTKEIQSELLSGGIDIAVHSLKDVANVLPDGLVLSTVLAREDVRDAFVSLKYKSIEDLPRDATVGTSSIRRRAQLASMRPDLQLVEFRGNVQTRLRKLDEGVADATFLACAGLQRLNRWELANPIPIEQMLPAVAQGAIAIEQRIADDAISAILAPINHAESAIRVTAERAFLHVLDGSCRTPIGGLALLDGDKLEFRGEVLRPDGSRLFNGVWHGDVSDAEAIGTKAGEALKAKAGEGFFD
ncbi:hydroxymethylbilane synthase [Rhodobacterales bacterium 52_120_T64]|nr:hydroxymethylbilane synthase [Rhodobacterales bacterium 52_120_T64]